MTGPGWTRRSFLTATLQVPALAAAQTRRPDYTFEQFHNQATDTPLHRNLVAMWAAIARDTGGRVTAAVHAENNGLPGGDQDALKMLLSGEITFFTLMGGILGQVSPVAEAQQLPFAFRSAAHAHDTLDGPFGRYVAESAAAQGVHLFPIGSFDNGRRQVASRERALVTPDDFAGIRIRVPPGQVIADTFRAFGAEPVTTTANQILDAMQSGRVDAQENPLAVIEGFRLYTVTKHISLTNHIWSGFNMMAHRPTWLRLPQDIRDVISRNVTMYVRRQRAEQQRFNDGLQATLAARGIVFHDVEARAFRARLSGVYSAWKERIGSRGWSLLESAVGRLV
jgi:tripartite ATP-independent transporter DctP family solute receptor